MQYRRTHHPGGSYFFTVVTHNRRPLFQNAANITLLRNAFKTVRNKHPFHIDAIVILPDHLHSIWTLPKNDTDYSTRWRLIKTHFSKHCASQPPIWQNRFWEHAIRNERDFDNHVDYIHYNPVKHGFVESVKDWPHSSFHRYVQQGLLAESWAADAKQLEGIGNE